MAFVCHDGDRRELWPYHPTMKTSNDEGNEEESKVKFDSLLAIRAIDYALEAAALSELMHRHGLDYIITSTGDPINVRDSFVNLSRRAGLHQIWSVSCLSSL